MATVTTVAVYAGLEKKHEDLLACWVQNGEICPNCLAYGTPEVCGHETEPADRPITTTDIAQFYELYLKYISDPARFWKDFDEASHLATVTSEEEMQELLRVFPRA